MLPDFLYEYQRQRISEKRGWPVSNKDMLMMGYGKITLKINEEMPAQRTQKEPNNE